MNANKCQECDFLCKSLFRNLSDEEIMKMEEWKHYLNYKKEEEIFLEGNDAQGMYCISKGKVKLVKYAENGHEKITDILTEGDFVGMEAIFLNQQHEINAVAMTEVDICVIPKSIINSFSEKNPKFLRGIVDHLCELRNTGYETNTSLAYDTIKARTISALLQLSSLLNSDQINITRTNIAKMIGTNEESISRALADLEKNGVIKRSRKTIEITDRKRLIHSI